MLKLKLGRQNSQAFQDGQNAQAQAQAKQQQTAQSPVSSSAPTPGGGFKLKLSVSQPPTPIEQSGQSSFLAAPTPATADKKKRPYTKKADGPGKGKKRAADDDNAPAPKRVASGAALSGPSRKISLKLPQTPATDIPQASSQKLKLSRKKSLPRLLDIRARGKVPQRQPGVGYDSEDSETEKDPAIQQAFVLRMEDGEDATYLRQAIADGKIGPRPEEGDADVKIKFIEKGYRRAVITIRKRLYGAVLVDLPCIVESMKSFDKKGWWKVADIAQMLLVLGPCNSEDEAKTMPLPREVNKENYQYAHGLTPPMHWARKRRFRKRLTYNESLNIEEEVEKLIAADKDREKAGGRTESQTQDGRNQRQASEQRSEIEYEEEDGEGAMETIEGDGQQYEFNLDAEGDEEDAEGDEDLEAKMQAMFDEAAEEGDISQLVTESPAPIVDQAASMAAVENAMAEDTDATPAATPMADTQDEQSDDEESEEDDEDSPDVIDEDAAAKAAERAQQLEEVADLEKEVERARQKSNAMTNQLLRQREMQRLAGLEEELATKKRVFGLEDEDE